MSCSICSHTLAGIDTGDPARRVYHCPRCGSIATHFADGRVDLTVPALVERVRTFYAETKPGDVYGLLRRHMHRLGIFEAVYLPGERPGESTKGVAHGTNR
jgi:hypothetical protein